MHFHHSESLKNTIFASKAAQLVYRLVFFLAQHVSWSFYHHRVEPQDFLFQLLSRQRSRLFSRSARNAKTPQSKGGTCAKTSEATMSIEKADQNGHTPVEPNRSFFSCIFRTFFSPIVPCQIGTSEIRDFLATRRLCRCTGSQKRHVLGHFHSADRPGRLHLRYVLDVARRKIPRFSIDTRRAKGGPKSL